MKTALILLFFAWNTLAIAQTPVLRKDFANYASDIMCSVDATSVRPVVLWKTGLFDAQIFGRHVSEIESRKIESVAKQFAQSQKYLGYSFGSCLNKQHWIVAMPSPFPMSELLISHNEKLLRKYCNKWEFKWAASGLFNVGRLPALNATTSQDLKSNGVIGVSCKPKHAPGVGSQLWFMMPTTQSFELPVPEAAAIKDFSKFGVWLNAVREKLKLKTLDFSSKVLANSANQLASPEGIAHPLALLEREAKILKSEKLILISEARVLAPTIQDALWLLWNSPQHRGTLLNENAKFAAVSVTKEANHFRLLLILAQSD